MFSCYLNTFFLPYHLREAVNRVESCQTLLGRRALLFKMLIVELSGEVVKLLKNYLHKPVLHASCHLICALLGVQGLQVSLCPLGNRNSRKPEARPERLWCLPRLELCQNFFPTPETLPYWPLGVKNLKQKNCWGDFSLSFLVTVGNCTRASCFWHYLSPSASRLSIKINLRLSTSRLSIKTNLTETGRTITTKSYPEQTFWEAPPPGSGGNEVKCLGSPTLAQYLVSFLHAPVLPGWIVQKGGSTRERGERFVFTKIVMMTFGSFT